MNLLFLGEVDLHEITFLPFLRSHGYSVTIINTSHWYFPATIEGADISVNNLYNGGKLGVPYFRILMRGQWLKKAIFYSLCKRYDKLTDKVKDIVKRGGIDLIYGSWGSGSLPEFGLLRKFSVPTVYEFLTYPNNRFSFAVRIENLLNRSVIESLSGKVLATWRMLNYMRKEFDIRCGKNIVFAECYPSKFFYQKRLPLLSGCDDQPHLIFIGMNAYEIMPQIEEIIRRQVHVHFLQHKRHKQKLRMLKFRDFTHTFEYFDYSKLSSGEFATFMTQFDGCLITYDFSKAPILDRFYNSIPNRFSISLTAGIPIVMPSGYLKGCEEIVNRHQIGFTYTDYDDLGDKLYNKELMDYYRRNAVLESKKFTLENNFQKFDNFLRQILDKA